MNSENKVDVWIYDKFNGSFLRQTYQNKSIPMPAFVYENLEWLENKDKPCYSRYQEFWIEVFRDFKKYKGGTEKTLWDYIMNRIGQGEGNMDWDFAKSLQLYDIISFSFLQGGNEFENNIYEICDDEYLVLILFKKEWKRPNVLALDFQVVHYDDLDKCHALLSNSGLIKKYN